MSGPCFLLPLYCKYSSVLVKVGESVDFLLHSIIYFTRISSIYESHLSLSTLGEDSILFLTYNAQRGNIVAAFSIETRHVWSVSKSVPSYYNVVLHLCVVPINYCYSLLADSWQRDVYVFFFGFVVYVFLVVLRWVRHLVYLYHARTFLLTLLYFKFEFSRIAIYLLSLQKLFFNYIFISFSAAEFNMHQCICDLIETFIETSLFRLRVFHTTELLIKILNVIEILTNKMSSFLIDSHWNGYISLPLITHRTFIYIRTHP